MKRNLLLSLSVGLAALSSVAQINLKLSDLQTLHELSAPMTRSGERPITDPRDDSGRIEVIMQFDSPSALNEIRARGGEIVNELTEGTAIVKVAPADVQNICRAEGVTGAELPRLLKLTNDQARVFSKVNDVLAGSGLPSGYDGTGVVVGLFDVGQDPNHINFKDADGNNRVKLWLQYSGNSSTPAESKTPLAVSRATTDNRDQSHGAHVAGIMAGSFKGTVNQTGGDYSGIAPGAEIVMAGGPGYNSQLLDAIKRIAKYAYDQQKPCVINLSFGDNMGPHDGSDSFTKAINDVAEQYDAVICISAGNERDENISLIKEMTADRPMVATLALPGSDTPSQYAESFYQCSGQVLIWTQDETPFELTLDVISTAKPEEVLYTYSIPEGQIGVTEVGGLASKIFGNGNNIKLTSEDLEFSKYYISSCMGGSRGLDPTNNRYCADLSFFLNSKNSSTKGRNFVRITVKGQPGKKIFMYCNGDYMTFGNKSKSVIDAPDGAGTNSNMASGPNTISVGSYISNNVSGSGYPTGTVGDISYFSSWGETPDGRVMPDVCTPGQVIISSRNSYYSGNGYPEMGVYEDPATKKTYKWTSCSGTSQASPHMAGIAALWRQANPLLTYKDIQYIARKTAVAPGFDSKGWGYGKADALAGIKMALDYSSIYEIIENAPESILIESIGNGIYDIYAPSEPSVTATVYNLQGIAVMNVSASGNSINLDTAGLPSGIYVLQVTAPHSRRTLKIRR